MIKIMKKKQNKKSVNWGGFNSTKIPLMSWWSNFLNNSQLNFGSGGSYNADEDEPTNPPEGWIPSLNPDIFIGNLSPEKAWVWTGSDYEWAHRDTEYGKQFVGIPSPAFITKYIWDFGDGNTIESTPEEPNVDHAFDEPGAYSVSCVTVYNDGTRKAGAINVIVEPLIDSVSWDFGDGTVVDEYATNHVYNEAGTYTVTVSINYSNGSALVRAREVVVYPNDPPTITLSVDNRRTDKETPIEFTVEASDTDGVVKLLEWEFGDGKTEEQDVWEGNDEIQVYSSSGTYTMSHLYEVEGNYTVTCTAIDNNGLETEAELTITVDDVEYIPSYAPFISTVSDVIDKTKVRVEDTWKDQSLLRGHIAGDLGSNRHPGDWGEGGPWEYPFDKWQLDYRIRDKKDLDTYLHFDNDKTSLIVNVEQDNSEFKEWPYSVVYKLYEPLPAGITEKTSAYVVQEKIPQHEDKVLLIDYVDEDIGALILRDPNTTELESPISDLETQYQTWDEILTGDTGVANELEDLIFSASNPVGSSYLNVDYSKYENFINFSSAKKRIENFKSKLENIELYTSQSNYYSSSVSGSSDIVASWDLKKRQTINSFMGYEKYLYFESSSYVSSSVGEYFDNSWPKTNSSKPYSLYPVTSSQVTEWYDNQIESASFYDMKNLNMLSNQLPMHVAGDDGNALFLNFLDMFGEYFDNIWSYIKHMPDIHNRDDDMSIGISKDLIFDVAKSLGLHMEDGKSLISLSQYSLGKIVSGSGDVTTHGLSDRDIAKDIQNRLINNLPFILKTKGTLRSLKAVLNCFGISTSILRIKEFGGADPPDAPPSYLQLRNFTKALDLKGGQYIETTWVDDTSSNRKPDTVEFRFKTATGSNQTLVQAGTDWAIRLTDNGSTDNYGYVSFLLNGVSGYKELSSSLLPVYNDKYFSVMMRRMTGSDSTGIDNEYQLFAKQYDESMEKIMFSSVVTMSIDGTTESSYNSAYVGDETSYIGGKPSDDFGSQFTGNMMEFRYWNSTLNTSSFDNHVEAPQSYDGNHISASYTDLVLRYSFNDNKNLDLDGDIGDTSADQSYIQSGSAIGYTEGNRPHFAAVADKLKVIMPNIGANRPTSNKIRIENNYIEVGSDGYIHLSATERKEKSNLDFAPLDSNKIGIYFSPTDVINEDIIMALGGADFYNFVGDPRDKWELSYKRLRLVRDSYWQKYTSPNNFWDYMRLIKNYDFSIFGQLKKLVPARANVLTGVVVEPNILERPKVIIGNPPYFENLSYESTIVIDDDIVVTGEMPKHSASIEINEDISLIGYHNQYTAPLNFTASTYTFTGNENTYTSLIEIEDFIIPGGYQQYSDGNVDTSDYLQQPTLVKFGEINGDWVEYQSGSVVLGGPKYVFVEAVQPFISASRLSDFNYEMELYFSSSFSQSMNWPYSSSYFRSSYDTRVEENISYNRLYYEGCKNTDETTLFGEKVVELTLTSPTVLVSQEPGDSKLRVE